MPLTDAKIQAIAQAVANRLEGALRAEVNELKQAMATSLQWRIDFIANCDERHAGLTTQKSQLDTLLEERQYRRGVQTVSIKVAAFVWSVFLVAATIIISNAGSILDGIRRGLGP